MFSPAHWLHMQHKKLFSIYRFKRCGIQAREPLDHVEREFVLEFGSAFREPDLVVYDIGASDGVVSKALLKLKNVKSIHAFEPIPASFEALRKRVEGYPEIVCHNVALGDSNRPTNLHLSGNPYSSSFLPMADLHEVEFPGSGTSRDIEVEVVKLDDFIATHRVPLPDVVKIDVQGFELEVLKGGLSALERAKYCILEMSFVELYHGAPLFDAVYQFMIARGFLLRGTGNVIANKFCEPLQIDGIFRRRD